MVNLSLLWMLSIQLWHFQEIQWPLMCLDLFWCFSDRQGIHGQSCQVIVQSLNFNDFPWTHKKVQNARKAFSKASKLRKTEPKIDKNKAYSGIYNRAVCYYPEPTSKQVIVCPTAWRSLGRFCYFHFISRFSRKNWIWKRSKRKNWNQNCLPQSKVFIKNQIKDHNIVCSCPFLQLDLCF